MKNGIIAQVILETGAILFTITAIFTGLEFFASLSVGESRYTVLLLSVTCMVIGLVLNAWGRKRKAARKAQETKQAQQVAAPDS